MPQVKEESRTQSVVNAVVGLAVLFGTVYLISRAWSKGQAPIKK